MCPWRTHSSWGHISSVQFLSRVQLFATPWIAACQASLSITNSQSLFMGHIPINNQSHFTMKVSERKVDYGGRCEWLCLGVSGPPRFRNNVLWIQARVEAFMRKKCYWKVSKYRVFLTWAELFWDGILFQGGKICFLCVWEKRVISSASQASNRSS